MTVSGHGAPDAVLAPRQAPAGLGSQPGHCSSRQAWPRPRPGILTVPGPGWQKTPPAKGVPDL